MSSAEAGRFTIGARAEALFEEREQIEARPCEDLAAMARFEEGQLCGPGGPKFVGFGDPVAAPLWRILLEHAAFGFGAGVAIFLLMNLGRWIFGR